MSQFGQRFTCFIFRLNELSKFMCPFIDYVSFHFHAHQHQLYHYSPARAVLGQVYNLIWLIFDCDIVSDMYAQCRLLNRRLCFIVVIFLWSPFNFPAHARPLYPIPNPLHLFHFLSFSIPIQFMLLPCRTLACSIFFFSCLRSVWLLISAFNRANCMVNCLSAVTTSQHIGVKMKKTPPAATTTKTRTRCLSAVATFRATVYVMSAHFNALIMAFAHLQATTREQMPIEAITIMD